MGTVGLGWVGCSAGDQGSGGAAGLGAWCSWGVALEGAGSAFGGQDTGGTGSSLERCGLGDQAEQGPVGVCVRGFGLGRASPGGRGVQDLAKEGRRVWGSGHF